MQVLYLDVAQDDTGEGLMHLQELVQDATQHMAEAGIESTDERALSPHVTVAKMSKVRRRRHSRQAPCKGIPKVLFA